MDYKDSGVNREEGDLFVETIRKRVEKKTRSEVLSSIGDFGGFFEAPKNLKEPVWVATTDGVGTKLLLAEEVGGESHRSIGQDVVAMCVNDLLACRAEPIIFLDYLATGKIERHLLEILIDGIARACDESGCSLVGGETAEMPGYYPAGRYDVAGFSIGVLEKSRRFQPKLIEVGDIIFGLPSSGFHSNGYSLVRKVLKDQNWKLSENLEGENLGAALLSPTRLYVRDFLAVDKNYNLRAASHITGGGLLENLPRGFDENSVYAVLARDKIKTSNVMKRFVDAAQLSETEAFSTWNMGIGFCVIVSASEAKKFEAQESKWIRLGQIEKKKNPADASAILV